MPVVGSSAYFKVSDVTPLSRAMLNDLQGLYYSDTVLIPCLNLAYKRVQRKLKNISSATFEVDIAYVVVALIAVDASAQASISDATAPPNQLPVDLVEPLELWERPNLSTQNFVPMVDVTNKGGLPSIQQGPTLMMWEWRQDMLNFVGATQDTQIRIRYRKMFPAATDGNSVILIRDAADAIAIGTAAIAAESRGSPLATQLDAAFEDAVEDLISGVTRAMQNRPRRRRPYSWRTSLGVPNF